MRVCGASVQIAVPIMVPSITTFFRRRERCSWQPGFFHIVQQNCEEHEMNKEHVKGAADKAKGAVEHAAGKVTGNERLKEKGNIDKAKGELHKAAGDIKDAAKRAAE
jgi:uncharacterized protein YjbJ (UPF0337 family)